MDFDNPKVYGDTFISVLFDPATMQGCTEDIGSSRIMFLEMFTAKYDLELVAGNFLNSIGGGAAVDELLCRFS